MSLPGHNGHLSNWKRFTTSKTPAKKKVLLNDGDIDQWMKRFHSTNVFFFALSVWKWHRSLQCLKYFIPRGQESAAIWWRYNALTNYKIMTTHTLKALLSDWMNSKLRLELEVGEDNENLMVPTETSSGPGDGFDTAPTTALDYSNFNEMYDQLAEEKEDCAVSSFLQDLMELEVLDSGVAEDLVLDTERKKKKVRDPTIAMEARHRQVRENRAQRDAERERQQRERKDRREAREEAKRREQEEEARRKQEAHRQEEMVQREMVRLRRRMKEKRDLEEKVRQREREGRDRERAASGLQSASPLPDKQQDQDKESIYREQQIQARKQMVHLKSLQKHFSGWYSVLLQQRMRLGKAAALCDWKRQLRVWRAWRALVWAGTRQREAQRMEEELRAENRQCQLAMESDRRRLMKRCLNEWQLWVRRQKEQRELLSQQEETRRKMAALLSAASTGKLNTTVEPCTTSETVAATPEMTDQPEPTEKSKDMLTQPHVRKDTQEDRQRSVPQALKLHPGINSLAGAVASRPTQPWQVTQRHAALTQGELQQARLRGAVLLSQSKSAAASRFEHRHAAQQQTIAQQRKQLKDQQQQIAQLQEERSIMGLKLEAQGTAELTLLPFNAAASKPVAGLNLDPDERRVHSIPGGKDEPSMALRKAIIRQASPHPIVMAMEERARQRAERRSEVEELKRKKEREKLAAMKAAEEERQREEEEEKRRAAERRRDERRLQREREQERQKQAERLQVLQRLALLHYHRTLLVRRGLEPWKFLLQRSRANGQLAEGHHNLSVMRRCVLAWQRLASHTYALKCAAADRLHQHFLLRRGLHCWKRLKDWRMIQEERAKRFHRRHTLRRILLALLDYVTQERLAEWDRQELAQEHSDRRVLRCCFLAWRQFPALLRIEREREVRREKLRRRVAEVLPDFHSSPLECLREQPLL